MNLSNRLTFSLIFSVLLVALFAFVTTPAMAIIEVAVSGDYTPDDTGTADVDEEQLVVTLTYSPVNPDGGTADTLLGTVDDTDTADVVETDFHPNVTIAQSGATITITVKADDDTNTPDGAVTFTVPGYDQVVVSNNGTDATFTGLTTDNKLELADGMLAGKGYLIIGNHVGGGTVDTVAYGTPLTATDGIVANDAAVVIYPTMPNISGAHVVRRSHWSTHSSVAMPDLYGHFQEGHRGTIDLTVTSDSMDFSSSTDADGIITTNRIGGVNGRSVVINEVMWARDESQVGGPGYTREQWIEVHNTRTAPVAIANIRLSVSNAHPAPANTSTDRLSTNPSFTSVWDITGKGQHGHPPAGDGSGAREFISMHRTKLDNGWSAGHWGVAGELFLPNYRGTPSQANSFAGLPGARTAPGADTPAKNKIVINEIGNLSGEADWVELKNISSDPQSLDKWALSIVTGFDNESEIVRFPNVSIPAGGVLLLVNADPVGTPLAAGNDVKLSAEDQAFGADGNISYLIVKGEANHGHTGVAINIPGNSDWMLILRSGQPWNVKDGRSVYNSGFRVEDVAGPALIEIKDLNAASPRKEKKSDGAVDGDIWQTTLFPLNGRGESGDKQVRHERANLSLEGFVHTRNTGLHGFQKHALSQAGFTGVGYDRDVPNNAAHGGTPGYDNGIAKGKVGDLADGGLIVSELMLTTDNGRYPQYIELHNTSKTNAINVAADGSDPKDGWQIKIENHNSGTWQSEKRPLNVTINLKAWFGIIPPNQTVLIVSTKGRNSDSDHFPDTRVAGIFETKKGDFKMANRRDMFLNAAGGFRIDIIDGDGNSSDSVGNLDGKAFDTRAGIDLDDPVGFDWPTDLTEDGDRTSLIRLRDDGVARVAVPTRAEDGSAMDSKGSVLPMGTAWRGAGKTGETGDKGLTFAKYADAAWVHAVDTPLADVQDTWYGSKDDLGTPGHTAGTPLPVSLSFFRPVLENGEIVIRWTTESELDNAGFNILRSDTRNGEFKKVNTELIQGNGTTGERSTYKWVDTTAKPGAVYYYQIEDVSFAGERQTLATTKLKGLISAKNKATTTWGDLKSKN